MKSTILFGFIAIAVSFSTSPVFADYGESLHDITGDWYVVATTNYNEDSLLKPRCWTIQISQSKPKMFEGTSRFIDMLSGQPIEAEFTAYEHSANVRQYDEEIHYFNNIYMKSGEGQTRAIRPKKLRYNPNDPVAVLSNINYEGAESELWDTLFISRRPDIISDMVPFADDYIDNTSCFV